MHTALCATGLGVCILGVPWAPQCFASLTAWLQVLWWGDLQGNRASIGFHMCLEMLSWRSLVSAVSCPDAGTTRCGQYCCRSWGERDLSLTAALALSFFHPQSHLGLVGTSRLEIFGYKHLVSWFYLWSLVQCLAYDSSNSVNLVALGDQPDGYIWGSFGRCLNVLAVRALSPFLKDSVSPGIEQHQGVPGTHTHPHTHACSSLG